MFRVIKTVNDIYSPEQGTRHGIPFKKFNFYFQFLPKFRPSLILERLTGRFILNTWIQNNSSKTKQSLQ